MTINERSLKYIDIGLVVIFAIIALFVPYYADEDTDTTYTIMSFKEGYRYYAVILLIIMVGAIILEAINRPQFSALCTSMLVGYMTDYPIMSTSEEYRNSVIILLLLIAIAAVSVSIVEAFEISDKRLIDNNVEPSVLKSTDTDFDLHALMEFKNLLDQGIITEEEFDAKKMPF